MGVVPACQGHTALHFPNLRVLLTPDTCAAEVLLLQAGRPARSVRRALTSALGGFVHSPGRMWGTPDPRQLPLRTEPHWSPQRRNFRGAFPRPPSATNTTPLCVVPHRPNRFGRLLRLLRGWNLSRGREMRRLPRQPRAHQTSGCCSLPPPLPKASRQRRSP